MCSRLLLLLVGGLQALLSSSSVVIVAFTAASPFRTTRCGRASAGGSSRTALWLEGGGGRGGGAPGEPVLRDVLDVIEKGFKDVNARIDGINGRIDGINGRIDDARIDARIDGINGRIDGINSRIDGISGRFDGEFARIDGKLDRINGEFARINGEFARINGEFARINREFARVNTQLGSAAEGRARDVAVDLLGREYARSLVARSIQDLLLCLPAVEDPLTTYSEWGRRAMETVLRDQVPEGLMGCVASKLAKLSGAPSWVGTDGALDFKALGFFIGRCEDDSTRISLIKLRDVLAISDKRDRVEAMLRCNSAGLMCVTAAAHPGLYLNASSPHLFPPELLEFDMRGRVEFPAREPRFAYIDIGEVKMSLGYQEAVAQLGLRLGVLKWLVVQTQSYNQSEADIRLVGRLFCGRSSVHDGGGSLVPVDQINRAATEWGFSLYMHLYG